jgi:hypothetical protein
MKKISWIGSRGNEIELRATCKTYMRETEHNLDGWVVKGKPEPHTEANLELWVDNKKMDSCWNTNFWKIIDTRQGVKKVWGLNIGMSDEQAKKVETFLKNVIEPGKTEEVKAYENAKAEKEKQEKVEQAKRVIEAAKTTRKNADGTLMTREQARAWQKRYNDINNEGGDGYIPSVVTQEQYDRAKRILGV